MHLLNSIHYKPSILQNNIIFLPFSKQDGGTKKDVITVLIPKIPNDISVQHYLKKTVPQSHFALELQGLSPNAASNVERLNQTLLTLKLL